MFKCKSEVVPVHDMMVYEGVEVSFCPFITSSIDKRWMVSFMPQPLQPLEKKMGDGWARAQECFDKEMCYYVL